jgi:large conductance mechanosensitive channel
MKGFRAFLLRGNVVDLAVAVVIGVAFVAVITAFTNSVITPLIALIFGKHQIFDISFTVNGVQFPIFQLLNAVVAFLVTALIVYYFVVVPVNAMIARSRKEPPADPTTKKCPECLSEIPLGARRCAFCTSPQTA